MRVENFPWIEHAVKAKKNQVIRTCLLDRIVQVT